MEITGDPFMVPSHDSAMKWRVTQIIGDLQLDAEFLRHIILQVLESTLNPNEPTHPPLTTFAARAFERLAEEISISTECDIAAMHWYMTLPLTKDTLIDVLNRNISIPLDLPDDDDDDDDIAINDAGP